MKSFEWTVVGSDIGPLLLAATADGLVSVAFHADAPARDRAVDRLVAQLGGTPRQVASGAGAASAGGPAAPGRLAEPICQFAEYFAGRRRDFDLTLDWSLTSGFNREVLRELASGVPYGAVVGYGELAARVGRPDAAQAVGAAMGSNPLPLVVPCHRVVESDGSLGGFGGGRETKRKLLALEGVLPEPLF
ncbi:methylated-DNA--[protein]-cysteine S-methyltransferase [Streptomyces sp. NPDC019396]|uniref:methylated-DNA--[protein]-cysteine S-methyltransferase n=1 Tax=Streptomyces sp. NPDC019396 TaxID=3154687 RepID=UPI0033C1128A